MVNNIINPQLVENKYVYDFDTNLTLPVAIAVPAERLSQPMKLKPVSPPTKAPCE